MGLFQSLSVGVAGLKSQASKLGVVSDNIANSNTVGYKGGVAQFKTLVHGLNAAGYLAGGVAPGHHQLNHKIGLIQQTGEATDLSISGRGFFAVSDSSADGGDIFYTRAGSFTKNSSGYFLNSSGYFLKGWRLEQDGSVPTALSDSTLTQSAAEAALVSINIDALSVDALPTTTVSLQANLKASQTVKTNSTVSVNGTLTSTQAATPSTTVDITANLNSNETAFAGSYDALDELHNMSVGVVTPHFSKTFSVYDDDGAERSVTIGYLKTAANTWQVEVYAKAAAEITPAVGYPDGLISYGTVTFDSAGALATISNTLTNAMDIDWNTPTSTSSLAFDFGEIGTEDGLHQSTQISTTIVTASPTYDPTSDTTSMASGGVTPHHIRTLSLTDNSGATRDITLNFLKTATHVWDVEILSDPATDLATAPSGVDGQIAYGQIIFNTDGTIRSVSSSISDPIAIDWVGSTELSSLFVNFYPVSPALGLKEQNAAFASTATVVENYSPIDSDINMTSENITPHFNRPIQIVDSDGELQNLNLMFLKTGTNTWAIEVAADGTQVAHGVVTFNGDGTPASISDALTQEIAITWAGGATSAITLDLGTVGAVAGTTGETVFGLSDGLTQVSTNYQVFSATQNGSVAGESSTLSIDNEGIVRGHYIHGSVRALFKIPLATFISPDRLQALSSNVYDESRNSGDAVYVQAADTEDTEIVSGTLESSNIDLANEMSNMLIAQRAYQSNSKLITVTDNMLDTLIRQT